MWHEKFDLDECWIFCCKSNVDGNFKVRECVLGASKIFWPTSGGHRALGRWEVLVKTLEWRVLGHGKWVLSAQGTTRHRYVTFIQANKDWTFWGAISYTGISSFNNLSHFERPQNRICFVQTSVLCLWKMKFLLKICWKRALFQKLLFKISVIWHQNLT